MSKPDSTERRTCPSYPGYSASTDGEIFSHWKRLGLGPGGGSRCEVRMDFFKKLRAWQGRGGYLYVSCKKTSGAQSESVHAMVADAFYGPRPAGFHVRHKDGVIHNVTAANLCYGTPKENADDKVKHGTVLLGNAHQNTVHSDAMIFALRNKLLNGASVAEVAAEFSMTSNYVTRIATGAVRRSAGGPIFEPKARTRLANGTFAPIFFDQISKGTSVPMFSV